ncbi:metal-dependent transcriptional regulator [Clostridiaceae bacterium M8S5]|nr:metal-dependent transcriptional regulator [Clostridiaceae bacterium M8S5]
MTKYEENYIKSIYEKTEMENNIVKVSEIAQEFQYTNQSVIEMIKKMEARGYVKYLPYKGVALTELGKKIGARMVRVHRLWEVFLACELGMKWDEVDKEAHLLEHATSKLLEEKLYEYLGKPIFCPHGNPISDEHGDTTTAQYTSMDKVKCFDVFAVKKVKDVPSLLKYLDDRGIRIGSKIHIQSILQHDGMIEGLYLGKEVFISKEASKLIFGVIIESDGKEK